MNTLLLIIITGLKLNLKKWQHNYKAVILFLSDSDKI